MSEILKSISIPTDTDGFFLLQCPLCREYFKLRPTDFESDDVIEIACPACGIKSESYLTEDVIKLSMAIAQNCAMDLVFDSFKKLERKTRRSTVSFKACKQPRHKEEYSIQASIEVMEIIKHPCCNREVKINPLYKICGSYCPYCGVRHDGY